DVDLARRQQHLFELAVDHVAVDVNVGEAVVGPQRLDLGDGVGEGGGVPQSYVVYEACVRVDVEIFLKRGGEGDLGAARQAVGDEGRLNVAGDVVLLELQLVGSHVGRPHDGRDHGIGEERGGHDDAGHAQAAHPDQRNGAEQRQDDDP